MDLAGLVVQLLQCISAPISRCWKYHKGLKDNVVTLKERMEELNCRKSDILSRLGTAVVQGETKSKDEVQLWLQRVEKISAEINATNEEVNAVKCFSQARIGKNVIQKIEEVQKLHSNGEFPDGLVIPLQQQTGEILPAPTLRGETTSQRKMEEIWAFLMGEEVRKVGVYGMGGIGKTTVMKYINNRLLEKKEKFDGVIWVTVSKASSIIKLQDAIALQIDFDISKYDDEIIRASKLYAELSKKRRYVLILDDLWDVYRLDEVGIPEPSPQNGSKLVLTTRLLNVCLGMSCEAIPMERLSETEALNLFLDTVGRDVLSIPSIEGVVNSVVRECACLPLAIVTIAGSLKGVVNHNDWKMALQDLKASTKGTNEIFEKLKFSYDRLRDKNLQACLLYCALFPEDYAIDRDMLIEYFIAEEIIKERNREAELERGEALLNKLVYASLLEDAVGQRGSASVRMHDLVRDMALQITSDSPRYLVEAGMGLKCVPDEEYWKEDLAKVSLMDNAISNIPSSFEPPNCPTLSTLLLNGNFNLNSISNDFFLHMKGLSLLDLSKTTIENLPESISELVNLTVLLLEGCWKLTCVPSLAKLTALKRLNFYRSGIKQVPEGMGNLIKLRYLEFDESELEIIPDGNFCELSNLRFLSFNLLRGATIKGEQLVDLRKLERLYCVLHDLNSLNAYVRSLEDGGPTYYVLQLGFTNGMYWAGTKKQDKVVHLVNCDLSESVATGGDCPLLLPQDVETLAIYRCRIDVSSLCQLASFEMVTNLRQCHIDDLGELQYLFSYSASIIRLLQKLETLDLEGVPDLRGLIGRENVESSPVPPGTFSNLKSLRVFNCNNIKRLFINGPLPNLEDIIVFGCAELVEIISTTSNDGEEEEEEDRDEEAGGSDKYQAITVTLPKLQDLGLSTLPKLRSIPVVADHSLRDVRIWGCPKLRRVPCLDRDPFPASLEFVRVDEHTWKSLEWDHPNAKDAVQSMRS